MRLDIETKGYRLALSERTYVMGVLNVTPDSFSEKGKFFDARKAVEHAVRMASDGADIIDVGGESTRPGAEDVSLEEEIRRVIPAIGAIAGSALRIPLSIDTRKSEVAERALQAGACMVNDVSGLAHDPRMAGVVARHKAALIVMHMKGTPRDMQSSPRYGNLIAELIRSLGESIAIAGRAGLAEEAIIIDPGIGFGKTVEHNLEILRRLDEFGLLGRPVCIGTSRKSFIGNILGIDDPAERLAGTLATCVAAVMKGANIVRVHDVKEVCQAVRMIDRITYGKKDR